MSTETALERELRRALTDAQVDLPPPDLAGRVDRGMRRTRRRRRVTGGVVALALTGAVTATALGDGSATRRAVDVARPAADGCSGMTVAATGAAAGEFAVVLANTGPGACDVRTLTLRARDVPGLSDRAGPEDLSPGDPVTTGPLARDAEVLLRVLTDTCQAAGLPMVLTFVGGTTLDVDFPRPLGGNMCVQPGFDVEIIALTSSTTAGPDATPAG